MIMVWLVILSMLVMAAYTAAVCIKAKGVPYSISATYYKLQHPYWFMAAMWVTAGLLMPAVLEASKLGTEFLAFLACAGMLFVGAAPNFREELEGKVHMSGAVVCVVASQLWVAFNCWWILLPVWGAYLTYTIISVSRQKQGVFLYKFLQTKPMFWVEITALSATYVAIAFKSLLK